MIYIFASEIYCICDFVCKEIVVGLGIDLSFQKMESQTTKVETSDLIFDVIDFILQQKHQFSTFFYHLKKKSTHFLAFLNSDGNALNFD